MQQTINNAALAGSANGNEKGNDFMQIKEFLYIFLGKWYWFLLSVIICVGIALFYILRTPPVYERSTEIQVKSEERGKSMPGGVQSFNDLGIFRSSTNVYNEMQAFSSPDNMNEIVRILNLDMNYSIDGRFHKHTLYGRNLPFQVTIGGIADNESVAFDLLVKGNHVSLSNLKYFDDGDEVESKAEIKGNLNDSIKTPVGKIYVAPTESFLPTESYPTIHVNRSTIYATSRHYLGAINLGLVNKESDVLSISCRDVSPQRAEDILSTLIKVYNQRWVDDKNQVTESTSKFIKERLDIITGDLLEVDGGISDIKSANLTPDLGQAASMYMTQSAELSKEILDLNNKVFMARHILQLVQGSPKSTIIPVNTGIGSTSIETQIANYNTYVIDRNNKASESSEQNSIVQQADAILADMRQAIIASLDNQIRALDIQITNLQRSERQTTGKIASNPEQAKELLSVERQQKVKESLYLFLLQKLEENELSQAFTAYNTRIIKQPAGSILPISPKRSQILLIALLIGLAIPALIIYLKEQFNTTVRGRQDLNNLTIPFLGEIPQEGKHETTHFWQKKINEEKTTKIVVQQGKRDIINEAFRVVRTNLEFMTKENASNVILFTSYNVNSGKTFVSMNMAMTLALKGNKVLVIDGDLRKASLSSYVNSPKTGLSNYLNGELDNINDVIVQHEEFKTLFILPVGTIPPNPTELVAETRFGEAIDKLRQQFDYIFIDCPPIEILADTQIIEKLTDRTLFVVRAGLMERALLNDLESIYQDQKFKNMSLILNGTMTANGYYGSHYGYGAYYGYGSRYGANYGYTEKKKKFWFF